MQNTLSARQMARLLKKLPIRDGDVLLVKQSKFNEKEVMEALRQGVAKMNINGIYVIMVENFDDIKSLNVQEMNANGWYSVSQINRVVKRG